MIYQIGGDHDGRHSTLSIDGTVVQTIAPQSGSSDWALNSFQIPAQYLDGGILMLVKFNLHAASSPGGVVGGAMIDDVTLDCTQGTAAAAPLRAPAAPARKHRH